MSNVRCAVCQGNDASMPCAYPSEGLPGCLRDARLNRELLANIAKKLSVAFCSAQVFGTNDSVTGYRFKTGAIHHVVGLLVGAGYPVVIPANLPNAEEN